ncbi:uncharacterized protein LOC130228708 [Danio aesculapii]|uniref:uncharacterized protein LOC130228708 n=1 Tax=Danio aesculapii TaxID=1142201 RepID=UPI0024C05D8C|nr:uncharacterized protein LOC130228708 [Danio aesculapii]
MSKRKRISPVEDATTHILSGKDKPCFEERFINSHKGRGVFASMSIDKGCFILEYRGKLISQEESQIRQNKYSETENTFLFDFDWDGKQWCIDASKEDGSLGRLVNDDYKSPNCKIKKIGVGGKPHLCLFSIKDIASGEEITYNYGDSKWPWRTLINRADSCSDENTPSEEAACFPTKINQKSTEQINRADSCSDENTPSEEAACCPTKINKKSTEQINRADSCSDENTPSEEAACCPTKINKKSTEQINRADSCSDENTPSEEAACFPTKINKKSTEQINRADSCSDENTPSEEAACCPTKINKKSTEQINRADSCSDENTPSEEAACFPTKINKKSTEQINRADSCSDENTPSEEAACCPTKINKKSTEQLHRFAARINRLREHHNRHAERFEKLSEALVIEGRVPDSSANDESEISCEESCSDYSDKDYVPDSDSSSSDSSCRSEELYNLHAKPLKGGVVGFQSTTDRSATDRSAADRSASALNNRSTSVTPMPTDLQINRYKKKQYCVYCQKPFSKIARHLEFVHHNELEVAKAFSFDKKSKERRARLHLLKSRGNFAHNAAVSKAGIGEMVACRRPKEEKSTSDFSHCIHCQGLYNRKTLWRHMRTCPQNPTNEKHTVGQRRVQSLISLSLPPTSGC